MSSIFGETIKYSKDQIYKFPGRTLYDLLVSNFGLIGKTTKDVGQNVEIYRDLFNGREITVKKDGIIDSDYSKTSLRTISLSQLDSLIIKDDPDKGGFLVELFEINPIEKEHFSEVIYRDAYLNYRDLDFVVSQQFSENYRFRLIGNLTEFKDNREEEDIFLYPYLKQDFKFGVTRKGDNYTNDLKFGFFKEDRYNLLTDSLKESDTKYHLQNSIFYNFNKDNQLNNRVRIIYGERNRNSYYEISGNYEYVQNSTYGALKYSGDYNYSSGLKYKSNNFYNCISFRNRFTPMIVQENSLSFQSKYRESGKFSYTNNTTIKDLLENTLNITYRDNSRDSYIYNKTICQILKIIHNPKEKEKIRSNLEIGYEIFNDIEKERKFDAIFFRFTTNIFSKFYFKSSYWHNIGKKNRPTTTIYSSISSLEYNNMFFEDNLSLSTGLFYKYSEFYNDISNKQIINNLGFKIVLALGDLEFYYSVHNLYRDKYSIDNYEDTIFNKHYIHQTINGFNMMGYDEIWGIRWVFYN